MKKLYALVILICSITFTAIGQVSINNNNDAPDPSAMLDVKSTDRGFLPPRMTTEQMNSIITPLEGLLVYNTSVNSLYWFNGTTWKRFNEFSFNESDPVFMAHPSSGISNSNITTWNSAYSNRITGASGTAPLSLLIAGNQLTGSITAANSSTNGYLTSTDWNTFNNKQNALSFGSVSSSDMTISGGTNAVIGSGLNLTITKGSLTSSDLTITGGTNAVLGSGTALTVKKGNLTEATSSVLSITGGTNATLGTGTTIQVKQATTSQSGYLASTDWNTFNNKQNTLIFGNLTSTDITVTGGSSAVKGTGATLAVNKGNLTETGSSVLTISGGSNAVLGTTGTTLQVKQAGAVQSGYLSSSDWNSFNNKVSSQWVSNGQDITYNAGKVGLGTTSPVPSAALEVNSTTQGFLPPRMTIAQRDAISDPAIGLMIYCLDCPAPNNLQVYIGSAWNPIAYNRFPYVTEVVQTGNAIVSFILTGSYNYHDADNDPQGTSFYKWYRSDNLSGLNETLISGATNATYALVADDTAKYIRFAVVPVAQSGANPGSEIKAAGFIGPVVLWSCGISTLTVNHVTTGGVAPVNKTTTYGTVTNIPGETAKCWITKNLGATQQATAVSDATEASAGWYWQFNRKQGYKHDGSTLTPAWTITSINENSDWLTTNDPCNLELGPLWRMPTYTEWNNLASTGGWTSWNGPWGSGLKLHAAGFIILNGGSLGSRGSVGYYWSSKQNDATNGWLLGFDSGNSDLYGNNKAYGFSTRCVREY